MKIIIAFCAVIPFLVFGYPLNPTFKTQSQSYGAILIDWKTTDDPTSVCRNSPHIYNPHVIACAIRQGLRCTIYTKRTLDLATLGHEIRHCYEGDWHGPNERVD